MSLLLIFLHNLQRGRDDAVKLTELIFSEKYSKKSFNLDVPDRTACMEALFNQESGFMRTPKTGSEGKQLKQVKNSYRGKSSWLPAVDSSWPVIRRTKSRFRLSGMGRAWSAAAAGTTASGPTLRRLVVLCRPVLGSLGV